MTLINFFWDIIVIFFNSAAEIKRLQQQLREAEMEVARLSQLTDYRVYRDKIVDLKQENQNLKEENRRFKQEISELKKLNEKAKKKADRAAEVRYKKNTGGWRREDIDALRQFQDMPLAELSVMFPDHSMDDVQDMMSRIRNEEV